MLSESSNSRLSINSDIRTEYDYFFNGRGTNQYQDCQAVVIFGSGRKINDPKEKLNALKAVSDHLIPERWDDVRPPNQKELDATTVIAISLEEASAKIRTGPPSDDEDDYKLSVWAGVLPITLIKEELIPDPVLPDKIDIPNYFCLLYTSPSPRD